ncbi:hypothetical protein N9N67_02410 [Bacteriovoracaceae bacterium]|nr:hypothetical protein [Bacteriovoracaceae bacterium]
MRKLSSIYLFLFVISSTVVAKDFSFYYTGFEGRNRVYLSCDFAQDQAEKLIEKMGAEIIDSRCRGGIQPGWVTPVMVDVEYEFNEDNKTGDIFKIRSGFNDNCYYDTRLMNEFVRKNKKTLKFVRRNAGCFSSQSSYSYKIKVK